MAEHLRELAEADPDRPAIIDEFATITRSELNARVNRLVNGLRAAGVGPGDAVAVLWPATATRTSRRSWPAASASWILVPLNWHLTADELAYILNDSGAKALLVDTEFAAVAAEATKEARASPCAWPSEVTVPEGLRRLRGPPGRRLPRRARRPGQPAPTCSTHRAPPAGRRACGRPPSPSACPAPSTPRSCAGLAGMLHVPEGGVCLVNAPDLPRRPVPVLHAAGLPGRHPRHPPPVRPRGDAPAHRRVPGHDGLFRPHPLRPPPPPARRACEQASTAAA